MARDTPGMVVHVAVFELKENLEDICDFLSTKDAHRVSLVSVTSLSAVCVCAITSS